MKTHLFSLAFAVFALGTSAWAAAPNDQHSGHHPAGNASAPTTKEVPVKKGPGMAKMDVQTQAMRDMHEKMMAAKTPEERSALMADHMKTMQDGMSMMNEMPPGGMQSMKGNVAMHHQNDGEADGNDGRLHADDDGPFARGPGKVGRTP